MGNESVPENRVAANLVKYLSSYQGSEEVSKQWLQLNSGLEPEVLKRKMKAKIMDIQQRHRALYGTAVLVHEQTTQLLRCCESLLKHTEHPVSPSDSGFLFVEWILKQRSLTASAEETIKSAITLLHVCTDYVSESPFASSNKSNVPEAENRNSDPKAADSFAKCSGTTVESSLEKKYADGVRSGKWVSAVPESPKLETPDPPNRTKNESSQGSQDAKRPSLSLDKINSSQEDTPKSLNLMDSDEHPEPSKKKRRRAVRMLQDLTEKDAWEWRKYGQKPIKDSPLFRSYYRCNRSKEGCKAKKMVDHHALDSTPARVFIEGEHSHPPVAYNASKLLEAVTSDFHCENDGSNCTIDDEKERPEKRDELLDRSVSDKDVRSGLVFDFMGVGLHCGGTMQKVPKSELKMEINGSVISVENGY